MKPERKFTPDMVPDVLALAGALGIASGLYMLFGASWALLGSGGLFLGLGLYLARGRKA